VSLRSHPHDSSYLVLTGAKDSRDLAASIPFANEPHLPPSSSDVAGATELMGGPSATPIGASARLAN